MSRTYRINGKDQYRFAESGILEKREYVSVSDNKYCWYEHKITHIDPRSKEGKCLIAKCRAKPKAHMMIWHGPSWFHRLYTQRPYRRRCKTALHNFVKLTDYEVQLESKPHRDYWY